MTFQVNDKVMHDLRANGWPFAPEPATVTAVNKNGTFDIEKEDGSVIKGVRPSVLVAR